MSKKGFTFVELVMAVALLIIVSIGIGAGAKLFIEKREETLARGEVDLDLLRLYHEIGRVGKYARSCLVVTVNSNKALDCEIEFEPAAPRSTVRFVPVSNPKDTVEYLQRTPAGDWSLKRRFYSISKLTLCGEAELNAGCAIEPTNLNVLHARFPAGRENRYFRYEIVSKGQTHAGKNYETRLASAFHPRHPDSEGDVSYVWGQ